MEGRLGLETQPRAGETCVENAGKSMETGLLSAGRSINAIMLFSGSRARLCREQSRASLLYLPLYLPCHRNPQVIDNVHEVVCHGNRALLLYIFKKINISQLGFIILILKIISYDGFRALSGPRCPSGQQLSCRQDARASGTALGRHLWHLGHSSALWLPQGSDTRM